MDNQYKKCCKCKNSKSITLFHKNKSSKDGFSPACKECRAKETSSYYSKPGNKEKQILYSTAWAQSNPDKMKIYYSKYQSKLYHKLKSKYGNTIRRAIFSKKNSYVEILGCDSEYFKKHIESQFSEGMSWDNYGEIWELDHEIPLRAFGITDYENAKKAFHYSNTRPLFVSLNQSKMDKLPCGALARDIYKETQDDIWLCYNSI